VEREANWGGAHITKETDSQKEVEDMAKGIAA
jgi:hypothetical protein